MKRLGGKVGDVCCDVFALLKLPNGLFVFVCLCRLMKFYAWSRCGCSP